MDIKMDFNKDIKIDFNEFNEILNYFKNKNQEYVFINPTLSNNIKIAIQILFPNLNTQDYEVLFLFTENIIEKISNYNNFDKNNKDYYTQWTQNKYRDIKGIVLMLLPFIDDINNGILLNNMTDLNQFLYTHLKPNIPNLSHENRTDVLKSDFKFSNMSIGLLNKTKNTNLLQLFEDDSKMKLIYKIIHHNYLGLLRTLQIMNGKYYQNWINIVPILYKNSDNNLSFQNSNLYKKTKDGIQKIKDENMLGDFDKYYKFINEEYYGLYLGDIYNIIKIKMYDEIKYIKWLIFPRSTSSGNIYTIQYLGKKINIDMFFKYSNYDDIDIDEKIKFDNFIKNIYSYLKTKPFIFSVWKDILLFLTNNYSKRFVVENELKKELKSNIFQKFKLSSLEFENIDTADDEEYNKPIREKIKEINTNDVLEYLSTIKTKHIWNFLYETIKLFENTYLRDYFIETNDKTGKKQIIKISKANKKYYYRNTGLSFKNIYNIAKSITHYSNNNNGWVSHDSHSISFGIEQEIVFLNKFINEDDDDDGLNDWLNLRNNLKIEFNIIDDIKYKNKMKDIISEWHKIKLDIVFEILTKNGLLSEFNVVLDITDKTKYLSSIPYKKQQYSKMEKRMKDNKEWENAYYYLTNKQYKDLEKIEYENEKTKDEFFYFDLFSKDQSWYAFYAMDWISQINFFHHYIHHRVLYVTGATGQGKSTQVPKLLMYALKAYEMKNNGKIVCTQPRISPTKSNAERISYELGVPIFKTINKSSVEQKSDNFYVQMKHSDDSHTKNNCPHVTLKILTDGTLFEELLSNPMMKEQTFHIGKKDFTYGFKNHYDIVILDESHEHNPNMDMILTLMRQSCLYNNSLRLIIISATMNEDEPIYRSYFRCINDDLIYPIKAPLYKHPILPELLINNTCIPDTIYMDRRFHMSPPGETTQYIVSEIYKPSLLITDKLTDSLTDSLTNKEASIIAQEESYKTILEICQKYKTGDILLFLTGSNEIKKAIKYLNQFLPQGNIALPFYSNLHEKYKEIIAKISIKIHTIKNKRENVYLNWTENYVEDISVSAGTYKRAIIVATNVAEASITIDSLKFIVDTGYAKVNLFNDNNGLTQLNIEQITESSRIQRKGRIGRVSDGIAYFIYPKGSREQVKPKYKITQEEPTMMYLKILQTNKINEYTDEEHIISSLFDPNDYDSLFYTSTNTNTKDPLMLMKKKNIYYILKKQYSIKYGIINKQLYWNKKYYPKSIITNKCLKRVYSGQIMNSVSDISGEFYIIHPKENFIIRNINNEIIEFNNTELYSIPKYIFVKDINILMQKLILIDTNYSSNIFNINYENQNYVKTDIYQKVLDLQKVIGSYLLNENDYLTIFAAMGFGCLFEVLSILTLIKSVPTQKPIMSALIKFNQISQFYNLWYANISSKSEIFILNNICDKLKSENINLYIFKIINNPKILNDVDMLIKDKILNFKKKINLKLNIDIDDIVDWNLMKKLLNMGKLDNKSGHDEIKYAFLIKQINLDLDLNNIKIKVWCDNYFINYEYIKIYLINLGELIINFFTLDKNIDTEFEEVSPLLWINDIKQNFSKILKTNNIKEKIIKSFILGRPINYGIKLDSENIFYNLHSFKLNGYLDNSVLPISFSNIIFYYNYIDDDNYLSLNLVNDIDIDYFTSCLPHIFNKKYFKKIKPNIEYIHNKKTIIEKKSFIPITGSNYDQIIYFVNNNSMGLSPWENDKMPIISDYLKKLRI
jgi:hypothetical protein